MAGFRGHGYATLVVSMEKRKGRTSAKAANITIRSTTILCVRRDSKVVMAGDGQVTLGSEVLKGSAKKLRRLYNGKIVAGRHCS